MDGQIDVWINRQMDGQMDGQIDGQKDRKIDGWMNGLMDGWKNGWMDKKDKLSDLKKKTFSTRDRQINIWEIFPNLLHHIYIYILLFE